MILDVLKSLQQTKRGVKEVYFSKLKIQICQLVINGEEDEMKIKNSRKLFFQDSCLQSADVHRQAFHGVCFFS